MSQNGFKMIILQGCNDKESFRKSVDPASDAHECQHLITSSNYTSPIVMDSDQ